MKIAQLKIESSQKGFTLVEMLVVIAVVATLAGITVAGFRQGEKHKRVAFAAETAVNALRNAQLYSLSGKRLEGSACAPGGTLNQSPKSFIMRSSNYSSSLQVYGIDLCDQSVLLDTFILPENTRIQAGSIEINGSSPGDDIQFKYEPPFAVVTVSSTEAVNAGPFSSFTSAGMVVESSDGSVTKAVNVDGISGRIE